MTEISIVIPVYNEEQNVAPLLAELRATLEPLNRPYEVIVVDDGSSDGTYEESKKARDLLPALRVVELTRNFGQTAAIAAGFDLAKGSIVITTGR